MPVVSPMGEKKLKTFEPRACNPLVSYLVTLGYSAVKVDTVRVVSVGTVKDQPAAANQSF